MAKFWKIVSNNRKPYKKPSLSLPTCIIGVEISLDIIPARGVLKRTDGGEEEGREGCARFTR